MKKILIIGYGGTIGMMVDKKRNAIVPADNIDQLLELLPSIGEVGQIDFEVLSNVDSTNVTPLDWTKLAYFLSEKREDYDAFVITHGTNTMAYTACAISLALGKGFGKPIIFTGSQLPLSVYGNDARFNFENSIKAAMLASEKNINEVMIIFDDVILRASRAVKVSESNFRAFASPAFSNVGDIVSTGIYFNHYARISEKNSIFELRPDFDASVLTVDLVPGQMPSLIEEIIMSGKCKGLILKSHGAGSVPTVGDYSFLPLIQKATQQYKIPVLVTTKFLGGNASKTVNDEPAVQALEAGAISTIDMTDVMSQVKLMWILAGGYTDLSAIDAMIKNDFVGEVSV